MAKGEIKSKAAKMRAALSGGKAKKKKWSKGKTREKLQNAVLFDQKAYERFMSEVTKIKVVTIATLSERFKMNGSLARAIIKDLVQNGTIKPVRVTSKNPIYTKAD